MFIKVYKQNLNYVAKFDETLDISTTYMDKKIIERKEKFKAEESFHIAEPDMTLVKILDATDCHKYLDIGASKSFI